MVNEWACRRIRASSAWHLAVLQWSLVRTATLLSYARNGVSMSDTREFQSVVHAAEQAAAAGDYKSAEELLHAAALLQEASLGPLHPDLANTLNYLGVVCEIT